MRASRAKCRAHSAAFRRRVPDIARTSLQLDQHVAHGASHEPVTESCGYEKTKDEWQEHFWLQVEAIQGHWKIQWFNNIQCSWLWPWKLRTHRVEHFNDISMTSQLLKCKATWSKNTCPTCPSLTKTLRRRLSISFDPQSSQSSLRPHLAAPAIS